MFSTGIMLSILLIRVAPTFEWMSIVETVAKYIPLIIFANVFNVSISYGL